MLQYMMLKEMGYLSPEISVNVANDIKRSNANAKALNANQQKSKSKKAKAKSEITKVISQVTMEKDDVLYAYPGS